MTYVSAYMGSSSVKAPAVTIMDKLPSSDIFLNVIESPHPSVPLGLREA